MLYLFIVCQNAAIEILYVGLSFSVFFFMLPVVVLTAVIFLVRHLDLVLVLIWY